MEKLQETFCQTLKDYFYSDRFVGTQTALGKRLGVSQGQIANIFGKIRCGDETWRRAVAKEIGMKYEDMIGIPPADQKNVCFFDTIDKKICDTIKKIKNKNLVVKINQKLLEIEALDAEELEEIDESLQSKLKKLKKRKKKNEKCGHRSAVG